MAIGYACKLMGVPDTNFKSCIQKNATEENLLFIIAHNIKSLDHILEYNAKNDIQMFRISSDFIPFGSSPVNPLPWWELYGEELQFVGEKAKKNHIRLSMHPGQYTVLNSPNEEVVQRCREDLIYHTRILDSLGLSSESKIILHIGGAYGEKEKAMERFKSNYRLLPDNVKDRLIIENDDKIYTIEEVLSISEACNIPVVFDNLHNSVNPSKSNLTEQEWLSLCRKTWAGRDGKQKIHYSQQAEGKRVGSHSPFISISEFMEFYNSFDAKNTDIMLEVKDKNLSCVKCINCTNSALPVKKLEQEWAKYKYTVLEKNPNGYKNIRELLKDKKNADSIRFYEIIKESLISEENRGNMINGFSHVWGYFKSLATPKEKERFFLLLENFEKENTDSTKVKSELKKLAKKYSTEYLLNSYYFFL